MDERVDGRSLEALIRKGEVDTVLTVFPDHLGRLMGKRVVGRYFLDHVQGDGVHACIYLFTVDMEMEPLPGFTLTSWERGYGDMKLVPDLTTWRRLPWLPKTALVFCDVYTEEGEPIEEAPRWVLRRQVERARKAGYTRQDRLGARAVPLPRVVRRRPRQALPRPDARVELPRGLSHPPDLEGGGAGPRHPQPHGGGAGARGVLEGRVGARAGGDQPPLRGGARDGRPPRALQARRQGDRLAPGRPRSPSWRSTTWARRARPSTCTPRCGTPRAKNLFAKAGSRDGDAAVRPVGRRADGAGARARLLLRAHRQRVQALPGRLLRPHPDRVRAGTTARAASASAARGAASASRTASRAPTPTRTSRSRPPSRRGFTASSRKLEPPRMYEGNAYEDAALPQVPKTLREALAELERSTAAREAFGDEGGGALPAPRRASSSRRSTRRSRTGS